MQQLQRHGGSLQATLCGSGWKLADKAPLVCIAAWTASRSSGATIATSVCAIEAPEVGRQAVGASAAEIHGETAVCTHLTARRTKPPQGQLSPSGLVLDMHQ